MAGKADPYSDIDFEEINEATGLAHDEIKCLKVKFRIIQNKCCFDQTKPRFALTCSTPRSRTSSPPMTLARS